MIGKAPTLPPTAQAALSFLATENATNPNRRRLLRSGKGARGVEYGRTRREVLTFNGKPLRSSTFDAMLRRGWIVAEDNPDYFTITDAGRDALARDSKPAKTQKGSEGK